LEYLFRLLFIYVKAIWFNISIFRIKPNDLYGFDMSKFYLN